MRIKNSSRQNGRLVKVWKKLEKVVVWFEKSQIWKSCWKLIKLDARNNFWRKKISFDVKSRDLLRAFEMRTLNDIVNPETCVWSRLHTFSKIALFFREEDDISLLQNGKWYSWLGIDIHRMNPFRNWARLTKFLKFECCMANQSQKAFKN